MLRADFARLVKNHISWLSLNLGRNILGAMIAGFASSYALATPALHIDAREQKVAELRADLNIKVNVNQFDPMIPLLARTVAPTDANWNPENPKWPAVCNAIGNDVHADIADAVIQEQSSMDAKWEQALNQHVPESDLDRLLKFYRSDVGKRYMEFQKSLDPILNSAGAAFIGAISTGRPITAAGTDVDSPQTTAVRTHIIKLSFSNVLAGGTDEAAATMEARGMIEKVARTVYGNDLDTLATRYSGDLARFEIFNRSRDVAKIVDAAKSLTAAQASESKPSALQAILSSEPAKHAADWHALYAAK